jgi:hypothetical protein
VSVAIAKSKVITGNIKQKVSGLYRFLPPSLPNAKSQPAKLESIRFNSEYIHVKHGRPCCPASAIVNFHLLYDAETCKADVFKERLEPVNGFLRIAKAHGTRRA